jgi:hypothetical protein
MEIDRALGAACRLWPTVEPSEACTVRVTIDKIGDVNFLTDFGWGTEQCAR